MQNECNDGVLVGMSVPQCKWRSENSFHSIYFCLSSLLGYLESDLSHQVYTASDLSHIAFPPGL